MKKWVLVLLVVATPALYAQQETKVIELKFVDFRRVSQGGLLDPFQVQARGSGQTVVLGGLPGNIAAAEAFIRKLDVRARNVEATFYILAASPKSAESGPIPTELEPVIKQLKSAFTYQSFKLLETAIARGRENGEIGATGHLPTAETDPNMNNRRTYHLNSQRVAISPGEKGNMIRFDSLRFQINSLDMVRSNILKKPEYTTAGVNADIDVREGQKVVVGKSNFDGADGTFFLIVTARVVD